MVGRGEKTIYVGVDVCGGYPQKGYGRGFDTSDSEVESD